MYQACNNRKKKETSNYHKTKLFSLLAIEMKKTKNKNKY